MWRSHPRRRSSTGSFVSARVACSPYVDGKRLASDHVEQSLHVAEVTIDRWRLHPGGGAHRSRSYRAASAGGEQFSGGSALCGLERPASVPSATSAQTISR